MKQQWVVGGAVRDMLLHLEPKDIDFVWTGASVEDLTAMGFRPIEATAFPVFLDNLNQEHALARKEKKTGPGYHGFECEFDPSISIEQDLERRDLTVNSIAVKIEDWDTFSKNKDINLVVDPFNGINDLADRIMRHTSDAFHDDPIRLLRVCRLASRYNFTISIETYDLMKWMVRDGELDHLTTERVWQEFEKTMTESCGTYDFLNMLNNVGALKILMPEIVDNLSTFQYPLNEADTVESSVAIKCAIITSHMNQQAVGDFWRRMKAPNEVIWTATTSSMVQYTFNNNWSGSAYQILSLLQVSNAYNSVNGMTMVLNVVNAINPSWADRTSIISTAQWITKDISFSELTEDQRNTLRGKEIGEAINELRIAAIDGYLRLKQTLADTSQ